MRISISIIALIVLLPILALAQPSRPCIDSLIKAWQQDAHRQEAGAQARLTQENLMINAALGLPPDFKQTVSSADSLLKHRNDFRRRKALKPPMPDVIYALELHKISGLVEMIILELMAKNTDSVRTFVLGDKINVYMSQYLPALRLAQGDGTFETAQLGLHERLGINCLYLTPAMDSFWIRQLESQLVIDPKHPPAREITDLVAGRLCFRFLTDNELRMRDTPDHFVPDGLQNTRPWAQYPANWELRSYPYIAAIYFSADDDTAFVRVDFGMFVQEWQFGYDCDAGRWNLLWIIE